MALDMFLKMDDFRGESQDRQHKDEIEVLSFSWGLSNSGTAHTGGGAGAGKASFQDFHFTSTTQRSSPAIWLASATGRHIKQAVLSVRRAGTQEDFYKITLEEVLITSYQVGASEGSEDRAPTESTSLNFARIRTDYTMQDRTGRPGETFSAAFDISANTQE